jgi:hypothetical protein
MAHAQVQHQQQSSRQSHHCHPDNTTHSSSQATCAKSARMCTLLACVFGERASHRPPQQDTLHQHCKNYTTEHYRPINQVCLPGATRGTRSDHSTQTTPRALMPPMWRNVYNCGRAFQKHDAVAADVCTHQVMRGMQTQLPAAPRCSLEHSKQRLGLHHSNTRGAWAAPLKHKTASSDKCT